MTVRMRHTRAHTKNRRSHHSLSEPALSNDAQDGVHLRHRVSPTTGKYKGEQVIDLAKKDAKKALKKELKAQKQEDEAKEMEEMTKAMEEASKEEEKAEEVKEEKKEDK